MRGGRILEALQPIGRALMLPIAVLPVAALLLRLGQPDLLAIPFIAAAGQAIFDNLGLLFAAGVAVGLARENHGAAALAGIVCYLVATEGAKPLLAVPLATLADSSDPALRSLIENAWKAKEIAKLSVPAGILSGLIAGSLYNRFHAIRLPASLGFFGGRRFVPIVSGVAGIGLALAFGAGFPLFEAAVDRLSGWVVAVGSFGLFLYGLANRLLLVTGLHHIINNVVWFLVGDFHGATGDLKRFFAGDPTAGAFMAGFFPVMMFGLPAACYAMYRAAPTDRRRAVAGLYLSLALTSFLTGVTEPIEFTFLFLAPVLFVIHAVLTGIAMVVMNAMGVKLGFGFSAGLLDYVLNYGLATKPLLLIPVGIVYAVVYYALFSWGIRRFHVQTPGREPVPLQASAPVADGDRAAGFVAALGGAANLVSVDACTTRLRLVVGSAEALDRAALAALGARGTVDLGGGRIQVVVGPEADQLASDMRRIADGHPAAAMAGPVAGDASDQTGRQPEGDPRDEALVSLLSGVARGPWLARGRRLIGDDAGSIDRTPATDAVGIVHILSVGGSLHLLIDRPAQRIADALNGAGQRQHRQ